MRPLVASIALTLCLGATAPAGCTVEPVDTAMASSLSVPDGACASYQRVDVVEYVETGDPYLVDLDNAMREQTPRIEACSYDVAWVCFPCEVGLYATDPDLAPYPEGAQAFAHISSCTAEPVTRLRVTHTLCGEE